MATLQTPRYGFPWPDGAERVMDGDNAIGALAQAVEDALGVHGDALFNMVPQFARSSGPLALTQAFQIVPGASMIITPTVPETFLCIGVFDAYISTAGTGSLLGTINDNAVARPGQATFSVPGTGRATMVYACLIGATVGQHIVDLRARKEVNAGVGSIESAGIATNLIVVRFRTTITRALEGLGDTLGLEAEGKPA